MQLMSTYNSDSIYRLDLLLTEIIVKQLFLTIKQVLFILWMLNVSK